STSKAAKNAGPRTATASSTERSSVIPMVRALLSLERRASCPCSAASPSRPRRACRRQPLARDRRPPEPERGPCVVDADDTQRPQVQALGNGPDRVAVHIQPGCARSLSKEDPDRRGGA